MLGMRRAPAPLRVRLRADRASAGQPGRRAAPHLNAREQQLRPHRKLAGAWGGGRSGSLCLGKRGLQRRAGAARLRQGVVQLGCRLHRGALQRPQDKWLG